MQLLNISDQTCRIKSSVYLWNDSNCSAHGISLSSLISSNTHNSPFYVHCNVTRRQRFWTQPEQNENVRPLQKGFGRWTVIQTFNTASPNQPPPPPKTVAVKQLFPKIGSPSGFPLSLLSSVRSQKYVNIERPSLSEWYCSRSLSFFTACLCFFWAGGRGPWLFQTSRPGSCSKNKERKKSLKWLETFVETCSKESFLNSYPASVCISAGFI